MDSTVHHKVPQGPLTGKFPILMQYMSFSTPCLPQLQLWHLPWLVSVQPVGNSAHKCCSVTIYVSQRCCCNRNMFVPGRC